MRINDAGMYADGRDTQSGRDVLRSAVVADKERTARYKRRQIAERYAPNQRPNVLRFCDAVENARAEADLVGTADQDHVDTFLFNELIDEHAEVFFGPLFHLVAGGWMHADHALAEDPPRHRYAGEGFGRKRRW